MKKKINTIKGKLLLRGRLTLFLVLLMLVSSVIVIGILRNTSSEFFLEYNEMSVVQEFKLSLYQLLLHLNKHDLVFNDQEQLNDDNQLFLEILVHNSRSKLEQCIESISASHDLFILKEFPEMLNHIEDSSQKMFSTRYVDFEKREAILRNINSEINQSLKNLDIIVVETQLETLKYYDISKTVFRHSLFSIIGLGTIILIILAYSGFQFINRLTQPIKSFVSTTKKISAGDRGVSVEVKTGDEFESLADSFNKMLLDIERSTVSKTYLNNILNNMFDSLIVVHSDLTIVSVNNAVCKLLGNNKSWYEGKPLNIIFRSDTIDFSNNKTLEEYKKEIQAIDYFIDKNGLKIPQLISCSILKSEVGEVQEGLVLVGHNLSTRKKMEKEIEKTRKQRIIDINEAQEEERIRIATDIHDGLGQMLSAISYSVDRLLNADNPTKEDKTIIISNIQTQIKNAIREAKTLSHNLIPIVLKDFGLVIAIRNLVDRINESNEINLFFNAYDFEERIDPKIEKALYRICQEGLNNILKHADAESANIQLFNQDEIVVLVIDDNGKGFDMGAYEKNKKKGIGFISMKERVMSFGGTISIDSKIDLGTEIIVEIPINKII